MGNSFDKYPNAVLDYQIDWSDWLGSDTIATSTWTVPAGITKDEDSKTDTATTIWLSGGTAGTIYRIVNKIVTASERTEERMIEIRVLPYSILTREEAANALRCAVDDANMIDLLPLVDAYIQRATGRDWAADATIIPEAKSAARMLLVQWHENPAMVDNQSVLGFGLLAALTQLEAIAHYYYTFEGLDGAGYISLPAAREGDTVITLMGRVGLSGDQSASFESVITESGYIQQTSGSDLSDKWFTAYLVPASEI